MKKSTFSINYGISLLKIIMSFIVVTCHFGNGFTRELRNLAVPIFMFIAFFYSVDLMIFQDKVAIKKRLSRLILPYVGWPIIYWLFYKITYFLGFLEWSVTFNDLCLQIIFGSCKQICSPLWYMFDLIILTLLFMLVFHMQNIKKSFGILALISLISFILQYSGMNYSFFSQFRYEVSYTFGRMCEMFPYAFFGCFAGYFDIYTIIEKRRKTVMVVIALLIILLWNTYRIDINRQGWGYQGVLLMLISNLIVTFFYLIPLHNEHSKICWLITKVSKYTLGIYCVHLLVGRVLVDVIGELEFMTIPYFECVVIWIISLSVSSLISLIPSKWCKSLVN